MDGLQQHLLSLIIFLPTAGAGIIILLKESQRAIVRQVALGTSLVTFGLSLLLFTGFSANDHFQYIEKVEWIANYGISYHVGIDGISLLLVLLTTFITPVAILSSKVAINDRVKGFMVSLLVMETGMLGVFAALDMFLFYVFWEAMLIPMYLLIGIWGGERRLYAAIKFVLFTMFGSLLMLVAILVLYSLSKVQLGHYTTNYLELTSLTLSASMQTWLFLAFALSFAIKVPLFPFHTWLPDAHVEAPTAGSVILAGVLLKMGGYGFLRYCIPLFPQATAQFTPWIVGLAVIGIIYGGMVALVQTDIKKLVAYSSVSHLGYVVLGIFALSLQSVSGSIIQMVNHGLSTGALFLLVGMLYERTHTRQIADYGGLAEVMPHYSVVFIIVTLASIGLPGLNGFVGEFLIIVGSYGTQPTAAILAALGVILSAVYLLWMVHRVFYGPPGAILQASRDEAAPKLADLSRREWAVMVPILALIFVLGVYPKPFLSRIEPAVRRLVVTYQTAHGPVVPAAELVDEQLIMIEKEMN
ncbi:MAG: NADH-quinone oxidoreductase subunit M [Candidatus Marinimicrobia bacterium]|nr:NADH-quinone oxidoreductase subunit M [Candidatus Neomarinimicrobiota bacterium]